MSEIENFMAEIKNEGEPAFVDQEETETPSETPAENNQETETQPTQQGGEAPEGRPEGENTGEKKYKAFHEHPRWKEIYSKAKKVDQLEAELKEFRKFREDALSKFQNMGNGQEPIPQWFTNIFGDNQEAWQQYKENTQAEREAIKREVIEAIKAEEQRKQDEINRWNKWVDDEINSLQSEGLKFDRNKLLKVAIDYRPTDENGNIDLRKAYDILIKTQPQTGEVDQTKSQARKAIADSTTTKPKGDSQGKSVPTLAEVRKKSWSEIY